MLGPLPPLYRVVVALCALGVFVAAGAWITFTVSGPLLASAGAGAGAGFGAGIGGVVALLLLHDFSGAPAPHRARTRVRRRP